MLRPAAAILFLLSSVTVFAQTDASPDESEADADFYGELEVLQEYEDRDEKLGHLSFGRVGDSIDGYLSRKSDWSKLTGFNGMIESAPIFQEHLDGGGGFHANNETNLIAQWAIRDKQDADKGNLIIWYQFAATWGGQTTSDLMAKMGILSPPNGGDTAPGDSRDLTQHFTWEQKFSNDRVRIQIGKMTSRVLLNLNRYAVSDREDFLTPMLVNNPVAHYTARVGFGIFGEYKANGWYASAMIRDADADLSKRFIDFDSLSTGNWEYVGEFALTPNDLAGAIGGRWLSRNSARPLLAHAIGGLGVFWVLERTFSFYS
jgi:porin